MFGAQPITQNIAQTCLTQTLQRLDGGRRPHQLQICRSLLVQQFGRLGTMGTAARKGAAKLRKDLLQHWQQLSPDAVARVAWIGIRRVLDPAHIPEPQPVAQRLARHCQQGPEPLQPRSLPMAGHGCQTGHTCAARERQQQGLDLIVGMLGQHHGAYCIQRHTICSQPGLAGRLNQGRIAPLARRIFGALPLHVARIDGADLEDNAVAGA